MLCFPLPAAAQGRQGGPDGVQLQLQVVLVLKQGVVDAGPDENIGHPLDKVGGQAQPGGQLRGVRGIAGVYAPEKCLPLFPVFRAGVHLVHKAVLGPVEPGGEIGHPPEKAPDVGKVPGRPGHEVLLHPGHAVGGGLDNHVVLGAEVVDQGGVGHAAGLGQHLHAGALQAVLAEGVKADLQKLQPPLGIDVFPNGVHLPAAY